MAVSKKRTPARIRAAVDALLEQERTIQKVLAGEVCRLQRICTHPVDQLRECPWRENYYFHSDPEMRVCLVCGLAEEGWGRGRKLRWDRYDVPKITRDQLYEMRLTQCERDDDDD